MKRIIIKSLELIATILMALIVLGAAIGGAASGGFVGFLGGLIGGAITAIVLLGALFLLMDIADNTRRTAELLERQQQP
ncbi:MAG: hypothetical protein Tsb0016_22290 [Sphingomonadales bacterium]